ncbi:MAG: hypothetical protein KDN19_12600 [Verrucomicrobiae bacterium]|nr:hypothetical protein [Verrucomicrobiae bacterium]
MPGRTIPNPLSLATAMNPSTPAPRANQTVTVICPLPANFATWPKPMQDRFLRNALSSSPHH